MSALTLYFILMLDNISCFFGIMFWFGLVLGVILAIFLIFWNFTSGDYSYSNEDVLHIRKILRNISKYFYPIWAISIIPSIFLPDTKEASILYIAPKIISNPGVQQLPPKLLNLANKYLDEKLSTIVGKVENEK